jgi:hypothetical protein
VFKREKREKDLSVGDQKDEKSPFDPPSKEDKKRRKKV